MCQRISLLNPKLRTKYAEEFRAMRTELRAGIGALDTFSLVRRSSMIDFAKWRRGAVISVVLIHLIDCHSLMLNNTVTEFSFEQSTPVFLSGETTIAPVFGEIHFQCF
jgi:hypothetical protein